MEMGLHQTYWEKFSKVKKWKWGYTKAWLWAALPAWCQRKELQEARGCWWQFSLLPHVQMTRTQSHAQPVNTLQWPGTAAESALDFLWLRGWIWEWIPIPGIQGFTESRNYCTHTLWHSDIPGFRSNRNIWIQPGAAGIAMGTLRKVTLGRNSVCGYWSLALL